MSYMLDGDGNRLAEIINKLENRPDHDKIVQACKVFVFDDVEGIFTIFGHRTHVDYLDILRKEIGKALPIANIAFAGNLELDSSNLMLLGGGSSLGREYVQDSEAVQYVCEQLGQMLINIGSQYRLR